MVDAVERIKKRPRECLHNRPEKLHADKGYDAKKCHEALRRRGIKSRIARKGIESNQRPVPVGGGAHAGVGCPLPQAGVALRVASRHPRGVLAPLLFPHLTQLPILRVLQGTLVQALATKVLGNG